MTGLKVAITQFALRTEPDLETYLAHVAELIAAAAAAGAQVVLLPELASTGLLGAITDHIVTAATVSADYWQVLSGFADRIVAALADSAATHQIVVAGGSHNRLAEDGSLRNTAYLIYPDGRTVAQDKLHLTPPEHAMGTRGGDALAVSMIGPFTVATLICADIQFPELSRHLVERGVDLILCPSLTWNRRGVHRVRTGCQARAMENQLYVAMSPLVGCSGLPTDAPLHAVGHALVAGPVDKTIGCNDGLLALSTTAGEDLLVVDLDHDLLLASRARPETPGLSLRRPDLYTRLHHQLTTPSP